MRYRIIAGVVAVAWAMGSVAALAQSTPSVGDGSSSGYNKTQQQLLNSPGYSTGTASASVGDGSGPDYSKNQQRLAKSPGFSTGTASAKTNQ